jgi:kinesin family protein 13
MMGADYDVGIVPRMCDDLFLYIKDKTTDCLKFAIEVSFFEIYNEQVFDLLKHTGKPMKVRNHKVMGPYVEGLASLAVDCFKAGVQICSFQSTAFVRTLTL